MAIPIPARLIEFILLGPVDDRRQLQDSPLLGDVWVELGRRPDAPLDLLISPYRHENAAYLAGVLDEELPEAEFAPGEDGRVAYVQGLVAARLTFSQLLRFVVPKSNWWVAQWSSTVAAEKQAAGKAGAAPREHSVLRLLADRGRVAAAVDAVVAAARRWQAEQDSPLEISSVPRFVALAALLCWAATATADAADDAGAGAPKRKSDDTERQIGDVLERVDPTQAAACLCDLAEAAPEALVDEDGEPRALVYLVSLNRSAMPALERSVPAVKADAAHTVFKVECGNIAWAILDSGIDGRHRAFLGENGKSRIKGSYDFEHLRRIVSLGNRRDGVRQRNVEAILAKREQLVDPPTAEQAGQDLAQLAEDARQGSPVNWKLVERYVAIRPETPPPSPHGTHVAGILGGCRGDSDDEHEGMCPDIDLYDFRILAPGLKDTEFAIIAAMQFIRYLNERGSLKAIQGVNLSLSIPHDVRNFACGRTPICNESERLVDSGVVVVAAAGNHGYKNFQTLEGPYAGYAAFSITDPGNAESVITVGSTHRFWPHTYGVSFFSSRGPTGDGRVKPDLVAPGERIRAPLEVVGGRGTWGDLDGTSMAAPHVSGAAAMLMARYTELIEQPRRIKQILCDSATDLGRERTFQGHGMLDVLRAFQSL